MAANLFETTVGLERLLDYQLKRHSLLASNVSNSNTPGYRTQDLVFSDSLRTASRKMNATAQGHFGAARTPKALEFVKVKRGPVTNIDGNDGRVEREMARLTANKIRYNSSIEVLRRKLGLIKYAASERS